jgi:hypothetical protein
MRVSVYNDGDKPIRVILDGDTINDSMLESGEERVLESRDEGTLELRELGVPPGDLSGGDAP